MKTLIHFLVILGIMGFISGCKEKSEHVDALSEKIGYSSCLVYLNQQAFGKISSGTTFNVNDQGLISAMGTLKQVTKEWIVLEQEVDISGTEGKMSLWIPREVIICVRTDLNKSNQ